MQNNFKHLIGQEFSSVVLLSIREPSKVSYEEKKLLAKAVQLHSETLISDNPASQVVFGIMENINSHYGSGILNAGVLEESLPEDGIASNKKLVKHYFEEVSAFIMNDDAIEAMNRVGVRGFPNNCQRFTGVMLNNVGDVELDIEEDGIEINLKMYKGLLELTNFYHDHGKETLDENIKHIPLSCAFMQGEVVVEMGWVQGYIADCFEDIDPPEKRNNRTVDLFVVPYSTEVNYDSVSTDINLLHKGVKNEH